METQKPKKTINKNFFECLALRNQGITIENLRAFIFDMYEDFYNMVIPYQVEAAWIVPIHGVLTQRDGPVSYDNIRKAIEAGLKNPDIKDIILDIDSPGGDVLGVSDLAEFIFSSKLIKPIIAHVNSLAASAGYWLASACSRIDLAGDTCLVGSIGVVSIHVDRSKQEDNWGIKVTEITAGKYKRIASGHSPLSDEGRKVVQSQVDEFYNLFLNSVAKYRQMSLDAVLVAAEGKEFIGKKAIAVGLADNVLSPIMKGISMDEIEQLKKENEQLKQEIADLKKKLEEKNAPAPAQPPAGALQDAVAKGVKEERERMLALDNIENTGNAEIIAQAKKEGWTPQDTAYKILVAGKGKKNPINALILESKVIPQGSVDCIDEAVKIDIVVKEMKKAILS